MLQSVIKELLIVFIIFIPLEYLFPIWREKKAMRSLWRVDVIHVILTSALITIVLVTAISGISALINPVISEPFRAAIAGQPFILQFIEIVILADIGYYFGHRAFHTFPLLWRFHAVHHSIEDMDALAAHRLHPIDQGLTRGLTLGPILLMGFEPGALGLFAICGHAQFLLIHSNINIPFGPLRWVIASPQFHHWHHANHPQAYNRNFAGQISALDWIFGTAYLPDASSDAFPAAYGIDEPVGRDYADHLFGPFRPRPTHGPVQTVEEHPS